MRRVLLCLFFFFSWVAEWILFVLFILFTRITFSFFIVFVLLCFTLPGFFDDWQEIFFSRGLLVQVKFRVGWGNLFIVLFLVSFLRVLFFSVALIIVTVDCLLYILCCCLILPPIDCVRVLGRWEGIDGKDRLIELHGCFIDE